MEMLAPFGSHADCRRLSVILNRVGDKWAIQVVVSLRNHPRRFNELKRQVEGISKQMLAQTVRALERDGMVERTVCGTTPPQVNYALTALGHSLSEPAGQLVQWALSHLEIVAERRI